VRLAEAIAAASAAQNIVNPITDEVIVAKTS
jgi:hypothetical protein